METLFLLKYGELAIKGNNQGKFIRLLQHNLRHTCEGMHLRFVTRPGRFFLYCPEAGTDRVAQVLEKTFGITWFTVAKQVEKEIRAIEEAALWVADSEMTNGEKKTFRVSVRRSDKGFPLRSYDIACRLGNIIGEKYPYLAVDLTDPDWITNVEIRDRAYVYGHEVKGLGGLPAGCAGKGLLLLSGGIDSPVAGYLMGKRGLSLDALYFHTPPFTPPEAEAKVNDLARILSSYIPDISLGVVPFTDAQMWIKEHANPSEVTLLTRASMMKIADSVARARGCLSLVTGESLSQVASQTLSSIYFTDSFTSLPTFRPLIGSDKEEIITHARRIGTFDVSIRPFSDCCSVFAPEHPLIDPDFEHMKRSFESLDMEKHLEEAATRIVWKGQFSA
jgi:tRNA uracil 4-sulfurtransferase